MSPAYSRIRVRELLLQAVHNAIGAEDIPEVYVHPNGFTKVKLLASPAGDWAVRLHLWDRAANEHDIHSHRWSFASKVVLGSVREREYECTESDTDWLRASCVHSERGFYDVRAQEKCGLKQTKVRTHLAGSSYVRHWQTLHDVRPVRIPLITVVLQGPPQSASTVLVRSSHAPETGRVSIEVMSRREVESQLYRVLNYLGLS